MKFVGPGAAYYAAFFSLWALFWLVQSPVLRGLEQGQPAHRPPSQRYQGLAANAIPAAPPCPARIEVDVLPHSPLPDPSLPSDSAALALVLTAPRQNVRLLGRLVSPAAASSSFPTPPLRWHSNTFLLSTYVVVGAGAAAARGVLLGPC